MGFIRITSGILLFPIVLLTSVLLIPGLPPDVIFKEYHIRLPEEKILQLLDSNDILDNAELYYESPHIGIESVVELEDESIISSDQSGRIFKIRPDKSVVNLTNLKLPCKSSPFGGGAVDGSNNCGWPLGMRLVESEKSLYFMDYFGGMVKMDLNTGLYEVLLQANTIVDNKVGCTPEDLDVAKDGTIYWTDGSTYEDFFVEMLGHPSGRLIKYDPVTKKNEVLLDDLHFSNGVCLSDKEDFVIVAEMGSASIRRYYLRGENKGKGDVFIDGLPGYPDNIRSNGRGGFYVAIFQPWNQYSLNTHAYSTRPLLRKFILRMRSVLLNLFKYIRTIVPIPNVYLMELERSILELRPILRINERPQVAILAEISNSGEIIAIFNGKSGKMPNLSQVTAGKRYDYLVCPFDNKIWRIDKKFLKLNAS